MWTDVDTDNDFLNFSETADVAVSLIRNSKMLPLSLGIFGGWGAGKSSLLRLIEKQLTDDDKKRVVVKFDAWLYQNFDDARAALMETIASALFEAAKENQSLLDKIRQFSKRVNYLRLAGVAVDVGATIMGVPTFGAVTKGISTLEDNLTGDIAADDIESVKDAAQEVHRRTTGLLKPEEKRTPPREIKAFREEFASILKELDQTLIVFIDNLDRCLPRNAIHTLEAIRLFLFMPQTAFVVAADEDMIRHSVKEHYGDLKNNHINDYLDKIIQVPIRVPRLGVYEVRAYMFMLFASDASTPIDQLNSLQKRLERSLRESWKGAPISIDEVCAELENSEAANLRQVFELADRVSPILANSVQIMGNPRTVKRMMNIVRMRSQIARNRGMPLDESLITKLAIFEKCTNESAISDLYRIINDAANGAPQLFADLESKLDDPDSLVKLFPKNWTQSDFILDWLTLEPKLSGIDLRPAIYLSRETLPLRHLKEGLSAAATKAVEILLQVNSQVSKAAKKAIDALDENEFVVVMDTLISELRKASSWSSPPNGFYGALCLANSSASAGNRLSLFIKELGNSNQAWLNACTKEASWFDGGGSK